MALSQDDLNKPAELLVCKWEGHARCVYLNNFRVAGSKPWGGGDTLAKWNVTLKDVIRAFPALQKELGFDYLGNPVKKDAAVS